MSEYEPPEADARFHRYAYDVGDADHVPFVVVNVSPLRVVPETTGVTEFVGAAGVTYETMTIPEPPDPPLPSASPPPPPAPRP